MAKFQALSKKITLYFWTSFENGKVFKLRPKNIGRFLGGGCKWQIIKTSSKLRPWSECSLLYRRGKKEEKFIGEFLCDSCGFLVWVSVCFCPFRKVVSYHQDVCCQLEILAMDRKCP